MIQTKLFMKPQTTMAFIYVALFAGMTTVGIIQFLNLLLDQKIHLGIFIIQFLGMSVIASIFWLVALAVFGGPIGVMLNVLKLRSYHYYCIFGGLVPPVVILIWLRQPNNLNPVELSHNILLLLALSAFGVILGYIMWRLAFRKLTD